MTFIDFVTLIIFIMTIIVGICGGLGIAYLIIKYYERKNNIEY